MKKLRGKTGALIFRALRIIISWTCFLGFGGYLLNRVLEEMGFDSYDSAGLLWYFIFWGFVCGIIEAVERIDVTKYSGHNGFDGNYRRGR